MVPWLSFKDMARLVLSLLVVSSTLFMAARAAHAPSTVEFIKASCRVTRYPALCLQCLAGHANAIQRNEQHLALTALSVSLARAKSATAFVNKMTKVRGIRPREYQAVKDCIENMGDSIDRLSQSIPEFGHMGGGAGQDFVWHMSNVQTWVSAALTDENTCLDGFAGRVMDGNVKVAIRRRVSNVAQVTSNALALVNRFASKHDRAASSEKH